MKHRIRLAPVAAALLALAVPACQGKPGAGRGPGAPSEGPTLGPGGKKPDMTFPVEVAAVEAQRVEYTISAVGSLDAYERVQVTARVAGVVERVRFREGDQVTPGRVLAEIEPQRFRVAVAAAEAALAQARTSKADAEASLARRESAVAKHPGLITGEEVESFRTKVSLGDAQLASARASLEQAQLNLRDAHLRAPIGGVIETKSVETGQYVQPGTVLATLLRREPLLLRFKVPESDIAQIKAGMMANFRVRSVDQQWTAEIKHVAQAADDASRMVAIVAEVPKSAQHSALRPGAFAEVSIPIGASVDAPVIPEVAIRSSELGFLAYVVEGGVAKQRILTLGMRTADRKVEVRSGLAPGERLVVRGAEALRDGSKVRITDGPFAPPVATPPGAQPKAPGNAPRAANGRAG